MKMRDLIARLAARGVQVTERMVRHYIGEGLLPEPVQPRPNQAIYTEEHFHKLVLIDVLKRRGLPLREIAHEIPPSDDFAGPYYIDAYDKAMRDLEWINLTKPSSVKLYSLDEVTEELGPMAVELAWHLNLLPRKPVYDQIERHMLACIKNLLDNSRRNVEENPYIGLGDNPPLTIGDALIRSAMGDRNFVQQLDELARAIVDKTLTARTSWIYTALLHSLVVVRVRRAIYENAGNPPLQAWEDGPVSLESMEIQADKTPVWRKLFDELDKQHISAAEFFSCLEEGGARDEAAFAEIISRLVPPHLAQAKLLPLKPSWVMSDDDGCAQE